MCSGNDLCTAADAPLLERTAGPAAVRSVNALLHYDERGKNTHRIHTANGYEPGVMCVCVCVCARTASVQERTVSS